MNFTSLSTFFTQLYKNNRYTLLLSLLVLVAVVITINTKDEVQNRAPDTPTLRAAEIVTARDLVATDSLSILGNVRPASSAVINPERSGRVTRVNTTLGANVGAGQVLVELENASERAALLQAEGAYEAALAQSRQGDIGLTEAENGLRSALSAANAAKQSALTTMTDVIRNTIDQVFSDPRSAVPGLRLDARADTPVLNDERVHFEAQLNTIGSNLNFSDNPDQSLSELKLMQTEINRLLNFVDRILPLFSDPRSTSGFSPVEIAALQTQFTQSRASIVATQANLNTSVSGLESAVSALNRAGVVATGAAGVSQSDAQVRQALGVLRAAQANLEKTLLRTPISGTVNALDVKLGDFVDAQRPIGTIANNNEFEIVAFISDAERDLLEVGETVLADGASSTVAAIAPAINQETRKIEIRIESSATNLKAGDTVRITLPSNRVRTLNEASVLVPLTAIKFNGEEAYVLVPEAEQLVARTVSLGAVRGSSVSILNGLSVDDEFVKDARRFVIGDSFMAK